LDLGQSRVPITHLSRALEADRTDFRGKPEAPAPEAKPERAEDLEKAPVGAEPCEALAINQACPDGALRAYHRALSRHEKQNIQRDDVLIVFGRLHSVDRALTVEPDRC